MTTYFRRSEIEILMQQLVSAYAEECLSKGQMNPDFIELVKHNFFAKYVFYNPKKKVIEIGINESAGSTGLYPNIKVYRFPLEKIQNWMGQSFRFEKRDLDFYGKLLAGNARLEQMDVVVE